MLVLLRAEAEAGVTAAEEACDSRSERGQDVKEAFEQDFEATVGREDESG